MTEAQRRLRRSGRAMTSSAYIRAMDRRAGGRPAAGSGNGGGNGG